MKKKQNSLLSFVFCLLAAGGLNSCMYDLDNGNIDPNVTTTANPTALYSKCYACLILEGMDGSSDFKTDDAGKSTFLRNLFNANELSTDEAICWWTDGGLGDYGINRPTPSSDAIRYLYYRMIINVSYCNHYLELPEAQDDKTKLAAVRLIRAYLYYQLLDPFGNPPFITTISNEMPRQAHTCNSKYDANKSYSRAELMALGREYLFGWIESELKTAEADLMEAEPRTDTDVNYGRVDKAAAWLLLSRLYLNAGTYLNDDGQNNPYWKEALDYAELVINSPYRLFDESLQDKESKMWDFTPYDMLFCGNNGSNGASVEAVFPLLQDGKVTRAWGGTMFFIAAMWNSDMLTAYGMYAGTSSIGWAGMRARPQLAEKFTKTPANFVGKSAEDNRLMLEINPATRDDRAIFWGEGHTLSCMPNDGQGFFHGLAVPKWSNQYTTDATPHDAGEVDTDFFLLRAAEAYLNAAEAAIHTGDISKATEYVNTIRVRAHAAAVTTVTLDFVLDERAREFYFECLRRPDLIRNNKFGGLNVSYGWEGKGGNESYTGAPFEKYLNVYPIPSTEMMANITLIQNDGYTEIEK